MGTKLDFIREFSFFVSINLRIYSQINYQHSFPNTQQNCLSQIPFPILHISTLNPMNKFNVKQSFSSTTDQLRYKIILVGDASVGKSTLFMKFTQGDSYDTNRSKVTVIDFKLKQVNIPEEIDTIKLFIWDTAGQQRYRSIVSTYFKGCHGVILVFDLNEPTSFENAKTQWLPLIRKKAQFATVLLVGNKSDLQQKVPEQQVQRFAKQNKMMYIKTSVKHGTNIDDAFLKLASKVNSRKHQMQRPQSFYLKQKEQQKKKRNCCLFH